LYKAASSRYGVSIDGSDEQIAVKEENLRRSIFS